MIILVPQWWYYGDRNKIVWVEEYLHKIIAYLKGIVNNLKKSDTWKIKSAITSKFISPLYNDEMMKNVEYIEKMVK